MPLNQTAGVLLAGGRARRMGGGDKCLRTLSGRPLLAHAIDRAAAQVGPLAINANGDPARFSEFGLPVIADGIEGFAGPLAGVLAGLDWAATETPSSEFVASFATDAPFFPADLVACLQAAVAGGADMACAASGGRAHPVFGLWPVRLRDNLRRALVEEEIRKVDLWTARYQLVEVAFDDAKLDPFFNVNRPEDLVRAEDLLAENG